MASQPNVVFILADDMGCGDIGRVNGGLSETPAIDHLVEDGIVLTQAYAASCVCNPSRASLMTGRYPHRTGSIDTLEYRGLERLALRETTLADVLKRNGYATGLVGKWHLGAFDPRYHPNARGFDEAVCFQGGMHDYYQWTINYNGRFEKGDGRYLTDVWNDEACRFIERHKDEPFFLHLTYNAPHTPLQAPDEEVRVFEETGKFDKGVSMIYAMIRRMDKGIGMVLETLEKHGLSENTIVIFASDNGPALHRDGDRSMMRFNCNLRGGKGSTYEGGIRVPVIVRWPDGGLSGGREVGEMFHFCDLFPTVLAMTGVEKPADSLPIDGVDFLPVMLGEGGEGVDRRFWQWNRYSPVITCNAAVRNGDWKLVRPAIREAMQVPDLHWLRLCMYEHERMMEHGVVKDPEPPREIPPPPPAELFNLRDDPLEERNVAAEHPDVLSRLQSELETWFEDVEADRLSIDDEW